MPLFSKHGFIRCVFEKLELDSFLGNESTQNSASICTQVNGDYMKNFLVAASISCCLIPASKIAFGDSLTSFENKPANEDAITQALIHNIKAGLGDRRDAHPKAHGCVEDVKVRILENLDADLEQGLFSRAGEEFNAIIRFSSGSSNPEVSDHAPGGQGFALKILLPEEDQRRVADISGEEYFLDKKYYKTFDIISINGIHEFMVETVADYPEFFAGVGAAAKSAKEAAMSGASAETIALVSFKALDDNYLHLSGQEGKKRPREAALMKKLGALNIYDPTATSYQSWVPSLLGKNAVKYQINPCDDLVDATDSSILDELNLEKDPNFLRAVLKHRLLEKSLCFKIAVQKHEEGFPDVEDAVAAWPASTYIDVAEIRIPQKTKGSELASEELCEKLSFNPAHATPEHRPIGGIQRARSLIYAAIESERNKK